MDDISLAVVIGFALGFITRSLLTPTPASRKGPTE